MIPIPRSVLLVAVAALAAIAAAQTWRLAALQRDVARADLERATQIQEAERLARRAVETIADDTYRDLERARADAVTASAAVERLRRAASDAASAAPSPAPAGPAAEPASLVLADVLGRAAARAGELAAAFDAAHAAGRGCERAYDTEAVTNVP